MLGLAAAWTPDALAAILRQSSALAALEGREAALVDAGLSAAGGALRLAGEETHLFREQIEFLTQKRPRPTRAWTDAMHGDHDRWFVVAGATDQALVEDFFAAIRDAAPRFDYKGFAAEFDRIVERHGWSYKGGRAWRIRTIFETNVRTSYMAGRLRQMRDPEMVRMRPWWEYLHADTRVPMEPRPEHESWDGLILRWDDPWWDTHFPPNDWMCSCGVRTLSDGDLRRRGRTGPDTAPALNLRPFTHKASGQTVMLPEGIGFGWNHMPGDLWERGLVPSALIGEDADPAKPARNLVEIDVPTPIDELVARARSFTAPMLARDLADAEYLRAWLNPLGADLGRANLFVDRTGTRIPISDAMLLDPQGRLKLRKRGRERYLARLAETILDPDEIWLGVTAKPMPGYPGREDLLIDRRYIRVDGDTGMIGVFQIGRRWWDETTVYPMSDGSPRRNLRLVDIRRGGKLLWSRFGKDDRPG